MMNQMKKLKQENQRSNLKTNKNRRPANRRPGKNKPKNFSRMIKSAEGKKKWLQNKYKIAADVNDCKTKLQNITNMQ